MSSSSMTHRQTQNLVADLERMAAAGEITLLEKRKRQSWGLRQACNRGSGAAILDRDTIVLNA